MIEPDELHIGAIVRCRPWVGDADSALEDDGHWGQPRQAMVVAFSRLGKPVVWFYGRKLGVDEVPRTGDHIQSYLSAVNLSPTGRTLWQATIPQLESWAELGRWCPLLTEVSRQAKQLLAELARVEREIADWEASGGDFSTFGGQP